jgi:hypothetical protein
MILLGAGASVPFDVPGMTGFTDQFILGYEKTSTLITDIRDAIDKSEEMIGISFSFDLETMLSVLNDLSGSNPKKPISVPTACLLIKQGLSLKTAREKYEEEASSALEKLRQFIFNTCIQPVKKGRKEGNFRFLDRVYGPLMTILNRTELRNIQPSIRKVYSTNWDLCFKTWVDYVNVPLDDWVDVDKQSFPVLTLSDRNRSGQGFIYTPLHGSLDLIKMNRLKGNGAYEDIFKIPDPLGYFEDKPNNIRDIFMIYPLEAIGYEDSVKSPYLDMLSDFRASLRTEAEVFVIGYSLRDPIIGSIFEEVIAERIRNGDLNPLSDNLDSRRKEVHDQRFKIIVLNNEPNRLAENLWKQSNNNLLQTFIPIEIEFPRAADSDFDEKYAQTLLKLMTNLVYMRYLDVGSAERLTGIVRSQYNIPIREEAFEWKRNK